ncbi:hypothetical protein NDU88_006244 [Pleurodeles waltl]|uniref:Uncharacterized protein n=1 Tax=Pleurodeles waltl TaxID=8319 RepID=A0AAV7N3I0_PLEWA|nr:hypothetical protein NDU88_006243 [Pleurodeles waltl]KAJ1108874.1 hypothetical protein NDU88_006244 [Pleurodeles waltl]
MKTRDRAQEQSEGRIQRAPRGTEGPPGSRRGGGSDPEVTGGRVEQRSLKGSDEAHRTPATGLRLKVEGMWRVAQVPELEDSAGTTGGAQTEGILEGVLGAQ